MKTEEDFEDIKKAFENAMRSTYPNHAISVGITYDGWNLRINFDLDSDNIETLDISGVRHVEWAYVIFNASIRSFVAGMATHALVH